MTTLPDMLRALSFLAWSGTTLAWAQSTPPSPTTAPQDSPQVMQSATPIPTATAPESSATSTASPSPTPSAPPSPEAERAARLERYRVIVENRNDSAATRIAQAEEMLDTGWPDAVDAMVAWLGNGDEAGTRAIVCQAITNIGRRNADRLDNRLIDPLLALLASPNEELTRVAAAALSTFPQPEAVRALSALAADDAASLRTRRAALAALAPNTQRREVVAALIELLESEPAQPELVASVVAALRTVSAVDYGEDAARWRAWWNQQSQLSDRAWLEDLLRLRSQRLARTEAAFEQYRADSEKRYTDLASRMAETLGALFRQTPQGERDAAITAWLEDPLTEYRRAATKLVAEQISEGNLPSEAVRAALVKRYADDSPEVRKRAVEILGALNEPSDATAMLLRLKVEQDPSVRETILRVLGKLRNPEAVPPLIEELAQANGSDDCVAAAADALGMLASRGGLDASVTATMIEPLKTRFARTDKLARKVRVAILGAMAATGSPQFKPEFEDHLAAEDPELLLRAIQGVAVVGNGSQLDRLSNLATHADARVRQRAIAAIGDLGGMDQLSIVVARMNPAVETVDGPRQAAWQAFRRICERQPLEAQVNAADRLIDLSTYRVEYLKELHDRLAKAAPAPPELGRVRLMLARTLSGMDRTGEALPYWQTLFSDLVAAKDPRQTEIALEYLQCVNANGKGEQIPGVLSVLAGGDAQRRRAAETLVIDHLDQLRSSGRDADVRALAALLDKVALESYPNLRSYLTALADAAPLVSTTGMN